MRSNLILPLCGSNSIGFWMEQKAARPKIGRPLRNLLPTLQGGFVSAIPSRAFRDGMGIFTVKLSHYPLCDSVFLYLAMQLGRERPDSMTRRSEVRGPRRWLGTPFELENKPAEGQFPRNLAR